MGTSLITNKTLWMAGYDISGQTNQISFEDGVNLLDDTTLGDETFSNTGGLFQASIGASGFDDSAAINSFQFDSVGSNNRLITLAEGTADGSYVYFFNATSGSYNIGGSVGELLTYDLAASANTKLVRGRIMENDTGRSGNSTGGSNRYPLGAVAAGQRLHLGVHILGVDDPSDSIVVSVESDATNAFGGSTESRMTTPALSGVSSHYQFSAEVNPHTWYRVVFSNVTGSSPSFDIVAVLGVI